jgi:signal transduction histidine kinase
MAKVVVAHRADGDEASRSELTTASAFPIEHNVCNDRLLSPKLRVNEVIAELTAECGIDVSVTTSGRLAEVPAALAGHAEAVLREALSNVVKHAAAANIHLDISVADDLMIEVRGDGDGTSKPGFRDGLDNLAEMTRDVPGSLTIDNVDTGGTRLRWMAPLS